jgi:hypothetical protein
VGNLAHAKISTLTHNDLGQFTGSERWYRHGINRLGLHTDGVKYLADTASAYWLLDEIAIVQRCEARAALAEFQVWRLTVNHDRSALLTADDGNDNIIYREEIAYSDFPLDDIKLYYSNNTILLPSEY